MKQLIKILSFGYAFFLMLSPAWSICSSKIVFIQDVSPTTASRQPEADRIAEAINQATNGNYVRVKFDSMHFKTHKGFGPYSLPAQALFFATQHCEENCTNADSFGRNNKCAIIYWGDNAIMHKNPFIQYTEIGDFHSILGQINTTHRFFVDLSYMPTTATVSPLLLNVAKEIKESTKAASYRGYQRPDDNSITDAEINKVIAGVMDKFGHSE